MLDTVDQVVQLTLLLLLDFVVFLLVLYSLLLINISHEFTMHTSLQLFVVIDVLGHPVDGILVASDVALIVSNLFSCQLDGMLEVVLLISELLNNESKLSIQVVVLSQFLILSICLQSELLSLNLPWRDVLSQISDFEIKNEFELGKLMGPLFELLNVVFSLSDFDVLIADVILEFLDFLL